MPSGLHFVLQFISPLDFILLLDFRTLKGYYYLWFLQCSKRIELNIYVDVILQSVHS